MKILILDSNDKPEDAAFAGAIHNLVKAWLSQNHQVETIALGEQEIRQCIGCWGCWVKTPGLCVHNDSMEQVYRAVMATDLVVFASPLAMGLVNALTKRTMDRLIPLIHPYILLIQGESHHKKRYDRYPELGVFLHPEDDTDDEDLRIVRRIFERVALNFHSKLRFVATSTQPLEEVLDERRAV